MFTVRQGYMRDRMLGPFLHQLAAEKHPIVQDDTIAVELADAYAAHGTWLDILRRAVSASTCQEGWPGAHLPIAGGASVVFKVKDVIYKFATKVLLLSLFSCKQPNFKTTCFLMA